MDGSHGKRTGRGGRMSSSLGKRTGFGFELELDLDLDLDFEIFLLGDRFDAIAIIIVDGLFCSVLCDWRECRKYVRVGSCFLCLPVGGKIVDEC